MQGKRKYYTALLLLIALTVIVEVLFVEPHYGMVWNIVPGADVILGFASAWILIILSKKIISPVFQRKNDYYENGGKEE